MKKLSILAFMFLFIACSDDMESEMPDDSGNNPEEPQPTDPDPVDPSSIVTWTGANMTFTKTAESDPTQSQNQDAITASVVITRGNDGGEIFNIVSETSASKGSSPAGTRWAVGELSDVANLSFSSFRNAVGSPKSVVGQDLVLHIEAEDVYLSVKFLSWGEGRTGAFSYERSTEN